MANKIKVFFEYLKRPIPLEMDFKNYDEYWASRKSSAASLNRAKTISRYIKENKRILDIGCGDGTLMELLSKNNKPKKIKGIDISNYAVEYVKQKGYNAQVLDILNKEFETFLKLHKFDYIIIAEVLEHIQEPERVFENIKKYCPKAIIFVSIPNTGFIMHRLRLFFGKFPVVVIVHHIKEHIRFWTVSDFKFWVKHLGYKIIRYESCSSTAIFGIDLGKIYPSLFSKQIIYKLEKI